MYPYLLYGNLVWGNSGPTTLWPIFRMQKIDIRQIFNIKRRNSTSPSFREEGIIKLTDLYNYCVTIFMHQFSRGKLQALFNDFFQSNNTIHNHSTRQADHFHPPIFKSNLGIKSLRKTGAEIWNSVVKSGYENLSIGQTKKRVKMKITDSY